MKRISKCGPREKRDDIIPDRYLQYNTLGTQRIARYLYIKILFDMLYKVNFSFFFITLVLNNTTAVMTIYDSHLCGTFILIFTRITLFY